MTVAVTLEQRQPHKARGGPRATCAALDCDRVLRSHNLIGYCREHRAEAPAVRAYKSSWHYDTTGRRVPDPDRLCGYPECDRVPSAQNRYGFCRRHQTCSPGGKLVRAANVLRYRARRRDLFVEHVDLLVVLRRDAETCHLCGEAVDLSAWQLDHVVPLALGGPHCYANVAVSHPLCNQSKNASVASGDPVRLADALEARMVFREMRGTVS